MAGPYYSQCQQDAFVHETFFKDLRGGVFVDVGAYDGICCSNTYFFEKELGWRGLCIEPNPHVFDKLRANRSCACVRACVAPEEGIQDFLSVSGMKNLSEGGALWSGLLSKYDTAHLLRIDLAMGAQEGQVELIRAPCFLLNTLLEEHALTHVHFLSIDTEGGELAILKSIDFDRFRIDVITVENNFNDPAFALFLKSKGYRVVKETYPDLIFHK